ncbi:MAG TPA: mandelate racemase/muconate lactonizing enzyme family protein [Actinospica sp.]|nr:mandelate racemase/muconate lactonizing enzyme family protein [Actinospica sp.]
MKITHIALERLRLPLDPPFETTLVRVRTDEGLTGAASSAGPMDGFEAHRQVFLGTDPLDIAAQVRAIETLNRRGGAYWPLEVAFWDLIGQATGQPIAALFGNAAKRLPAYASTGAPRSPAERADPAETAAAVRERGFRAMKIRIDPAGLREGVVAVRRIREAVGEGFEIMVDLGRLWHPAGNGEAAADLVRTRKLLAELAESGVFWVENPLPYPDLPGYKRLRADIPHVRIAAGGEHHSVPELLRSLELDALDIYQMDVVHAVGMSRARTLAELALLKHRGYTPRTWHDGLALLANLHVAAGVGGGPFVEFPYDPPAWTPRERDFMLAEPVDIDPDGFLTVPQRPGLGVEIDDEAVTRYRVY